MINILIVDDSKRKSKSIVDFVKGILAGSEYNIDLAMSVNTASKKCTDTSYDLVVLDLLLPINENSNPEKTGGLRFLNNINNRKEIKQPKNLIGLTSFEDIASTLTEDFHKSGYIISNYSTDSENWKNPLQSILCRLTPRPPQHWSFQIPTLALTLLIIAILALELTTNITITPTARMLIYLFSSLVVGLSVGESSKSFFRFKLKGFLFSTTSTAAVTLGTLLTLNSISTNNIPIGVFILKTEDTPTLAASDYEFVPKIQGSANRSEVFISDNQLIVVFPNHQEHARIEVFGPDGFKHELNLKYTPNRIQTITLND